MAKSSPADKKSDSASNIKATHLPLKGLEEKGNIGAKPNKLDKYSISADFWDALLDSLPPWMDEVLAIALLIFGVLSLIALFDSSNAVVAVAWKNIMTSLFGYGSLLVSAGLFLLGVVILLPKLGIVIKFPPPRVLALETAFLAILALLHLLNPDTELRAVARAGLGGGQIGWGLSLPAQLLGRPLTIFVYLIILLVSIGIITGIRRSHLTDAIQKSRARLQVYADRFMGEVEKLNNTPVNIEVPTNITKPDPLALSRRRVPLMRIRANLGNLPPSLRKPETSSVPPPLSVRNRVASPVSPTQLDETIEINQLFVGQRQLRLEFNQIGEEKQKGPDGELMVRRPDGRLKRYFTVDSMREAKKVPKREKSLPDLNLLQDIPLNIPDEEEINHNVVLIENTLLEFDIDIDVVNVQVGPTVTQYAVKPYRENKSGDETTYERTRINKIAALSSDLALALSAKRLRLESPVPGQTYMGVEVPNKHPSVVALRSVYESREFFEASLKAKTPLLVPLGRDVAGKPVVVDLATMPHLLIAGTTGSGKSVCIAALITSLILHQPPDQVQMVLLDPKMVELSRFNGLPHLIGPVETDPERIIEVLRWCTREMDRRYKLLEEHAARNIEIFNARQSSRKRGGEALPYIAIFVDEIGDLMMMRPEETEKSVTRLAQMARAVGMHLVVATQRPSVDVITGLIKANFPTRISFAVASGVDSRVILDATGAENLLGRGDMLYLATDASGPKRVQGCYVSDDEVRKVVEYWRDWQDKQVKAGKADSITVGPWERGLTRREFLSETDPMLEEAIELVVTSGEASASMIQRQLGLGYPRAARIIDMLEELGVIGEPVAGGRNRRVIIQPGQDPFKKALEKKLRDKK